MRGYRHDGYDTMTEATSLGLGSVWICWFDPEVVAHEFGLPETLEPINVLAIGYSDGPAKSPEQARDRENTCWRAPGMPLGVFLA